MLKLLARYRFSEVLQISFVGVFSVFAGGITLAHFSAAPVWIYFGALLTHIWSAYLFNDSADWADDQKNPRKKESAKPRTGLLLGAWLGAGLSLLLAAALSSSQFCFFILFNLAGFAYSCPPLSLKRRRPWPLIVHFLMGAGYSLSGARLEHSSSSDHWLLAAFWGIILCSGSLINEAIDRDADRAAGIQTMVGALSKSASAWTLFICHFTALLILFSWCALRGLGFSPWLIAAGSLHYFRQFHQFRRTFQFETLRRSARFLFAVLTLSTLFEIVFF